jgi:hypothetical protein
MINLVFLHTAGVTQSVQAVAGEIMRQISRGAVDTRALPTLRAVSRMLIDLALSTPIIGDTEADALRDMLITYATTFSAYLDTLEDGDAEASNQHRTDCDKLFPALHTATMRQIERTGEIADRFLLLPARRKS